MKEIIYQLPQLEFIRKVDLQFIMVDYHFVDIRNMGSLLCRTLYELDIHNG